MDNENIKEILEDMNYCPERAFIISTDEKHLLLDYITNLQEETERQSKAQVILDDENAELQGKITELQEENEKLKEKVHNQKVANAYEIVQIDKLQTNIKTQIRRRKKEAQLKRQYKTRIDKATKHIQENYSNEDGEIWHKDIETIFNILQGSDE